MSMPRPTDKPNGLTDSEGRIIAALVHQLRDVHPPVAPPPPAPAITKLQIATIVVAIVSPFVTLIGGGYFMTSYWRGQDDTKTRFEAIEKEQKASKEERAELKATVAAIEKDRSARIANIDGWRNNTEDELRTYRIALSEFRQLQGTVKEQGAALDRGRGERLADKDKVAEALSNLKTEVALLRQSMERGARREDRGPFGENQIWRGPPYPPILKVRARISADAALRVVERS